MLYYSLTEILFNPSNLSLVCILYILPISHELARWLHLQFMINVKLVGEIVNLLFDWEVLGFIPSFVRSKMILMLT
jgi:hypothetical protein